MNIAILTDTNSGISEQEAEELGVFMISMPVIIEGEIRYEGIDLTEEEFYDALKSEKEISTSQPSPADIVDKWDELLKQYDQVVYIPMSSGLSGSCMSAQGLATDYEGKVFVVDNHRIAVTMQSSVVEAKKMADSGKTGAEIKAFLEETAFDAPIYLVVETLEYLKRGGRVSAAVATIGNVLKIRPILTIQGEKIEPWAKVRGSMKKCKEKMLEALLAEWKERFPEYTPDHMRVGVAGAGLSTEEIEEWKKMAKEAFPESEVYYNPLSVSVGTHVGPGTYGIGVSFIKDF